MKRLYAMLMALLLLAGVAHAQAPGQNGNRIWIPATSFHFLVPSSGDLASAAGVFAMAGTPSQFGEISTFEVGGWQMASGDNVGTYMPWPYDKVNPLYPLAVRVWYASDSGDDDGARVWLFGMEEKVAHAAIEASTAAGLADQITFAATEAGDSTVTQYGMMFTVWDSISSASLNTYTRDALVEIGVELDDAGQSTADETHLLGVELLGVPHGYSQSTFVISGSTLLGQNSGLTLVRRSGY